ncbi:MAG: hypothetical protein NTV49_12535 [Kiritimatiellaeota bacterium]|nr:hypothetical protein [Kiritimatiellota bacterium]
MMRMKQCSCFSLAALVLAVATAAAATAPKTPRATVLRVVREAGGDLARPLARTGTDTQLPKFFDNDARRGETWAVYWQATGQGLPPGATVRFDYQLMAAPDLRSLSFPYDFTTRGERKTSFLIPEKDYRAGGNVKAWRVCIVHSGQILAERAAPNWMLPPVR